MGLILPALTRKSKPSCEDIGPASMGLRSMLFARSMNSFSRSLISGGIEAIRSPALSTSSVAMTLAPPPVPTTHVFGPLGGVMRSRATSISTISSMLYTRMAPACLRIPSHTASAPASEPVCEAAALRPPSVYPPL